MVARERRKVPPSTIRGIQTHITTRDIALFPSLQERQDNVRPETNQDPQNPLLSFEEELMEIEELFGIPKIEEEPLTKTVPLPEGQSQKVSTIQLLHGWYYTDTKNTKDGSKPPFKPSRVEKAGTKNNLVLKKLKKETSILEYYDYGFKEMKSTTSTLEHNGKYSPEMETAEATPAEAKSNEYPEAQNEDLARQASECNLHHDLQGTSLDTINEDILLRAFRERTEGKGRGENPNQGGRKSRG